MVQLFFIVFPYPGILGGKGYGGFRDDGCQLIGKVGAFFSGFQLFPELGPDGGVVQIGVDSVQTSEFQQQLRGGFGTHACNAGDIVGGIPHQSFEIDEFFGFKAVFLPEFFRGVEGGVCLTGLGDHQLDADIFLHQLQAVPVAGDDDALPAAS